MMMPSMPLVRAGREDKVSDLERFVRSEYREDCAGWLASGMELETGTTLPCANLSKESHARIQGAERTRRCESGCPSAEPAPARV